MTGIILLKTHIYSVTLFLLIYLIKTILLLANKKDALANFTKLVKVPEMIISVLFLLTGIWMFIEIGSIRTLQIVKLIAVFASIPLAIVGFKKSKKGLAVFSLVLIIVAFLFAEVNMMTKSKSVTSTTTASTDGKMIFKEKCAICHGMNGNLMLNKASDLSVTQLDENGIESTIKNGRIAVGKMPKFENLSDEQIKAVIGYVQSLKK